MHQRLEMNRKVNVFSPRCFSYSSPLGDVTCAFLRNGMVRSDPADPQILDSLLGKGRYPSKLVSAT